MSFVNPWFLAGLAAAALPVLIHILTRDRVKRVAFSTLRFFMGASTRILRRRKFQEMLLLMLRAAVCALLALAFARPLLVRKDSADGLDLSGSQTARVIVADVSASMSRPGLAEALRREARDALGGLSGGSDAAALVVFADAPQVQVRLTRDLAEIERAVALLAPGQGGTDMAAALKLADGLLRAVEGGRKEIVLLSDFQKCGWRNFRGDWRLSPDVRLIARALETDKAANGAEAAGNVAIAQAECPTGMVLDRVPRSVAARVANYSAQDLSGVEVELALGGKKIDSQRVNLRAGGTADVRFRQVFDTAGDNLGTVTVKLAEGQADRDPADNAWYFNARVSRQIGVVVLNGKPDGNPLSDAAFFVRLALAPVSDSPFAVKVVPAQSARPEDLRDAAVAVLANVNTVSAAVRDALADLLKRGGGLLFLPGDRAEAERFNREFADLAPARLRRAVSPAPSPGRPAPEAVLAKIDYQHPVFQDFARPHHGDLSMPRFKRYWEVSYLELGQPEAMRVPARFDDADRPAIVERRIHNGVSMLLASPAELSWNNFALRAIFLPYLQESVRYLAMRGDRPTAFRIGDTLPVRPECVLQDPTGRALPAGQTTLASVPGFYTEVGADGREQFVFAVNRDPAEADPTPLEAEKIVAAVQGTAATVGDLGTLATLGNEDKMADRLWWYVLLAVAVLVPAELYLANRTLRH